MNADVFENVVEKLRNATDATGSLLNIESIYYTCNGEAFLHEFTTQKLVNLRSIAKPIVCLALGRAIEDGMSWSGERISLSTIIWPYLKQIVEVRSLQCEQAWRQVTVRDLLRSTIGHDTGLLFSKDIKGRNPNTLLDYLVNVPVNGRVGHDFVYSNAGVFVLSSLISKFSKIDLDQFVHDLLFSRMGIREVRWDRFGGTVAGCTGLWMSNADLHKIGQLLLTGGVFEGDQLVSASYVAEMRTPQVVAPTHRYVAGRAFPKWSYGLCLWICEDGNFYCDGTDGQYLVVLPQRQAVVTVVASQPDTVPISDALGLLK